MPQTEEEHLIGLEEENDSVDGEFKPTQAHRNTEPDSEVNFIIGKGNILRF